MPISPLTLGPDCTTHAVLIGGGLLGGAIIGWALPFVAEWMVSLPWAPWQGPAKLVTAWQTGWTGYLLIAIGILAGGVFGLYALSDLVSVTIDRQSLTIGKQSARLVLPREDISGIFFDEKDLVLTGKGGAEVHRTRAETERRQLGEALLAYGWPYLDHDPFATRVTPWVPHAARLPADVNSMLEARSRALSQKKQDEAQGLARELGAAGYVVRDRNGQQHVTHLNPADT